MKLIYMQSKYCVVLHAHRVHVLTRKQQTLHSCGLHSVIRRDTNTYIYSVGFYRAKRDLTAPTKA